MKKIWLLLFLACSGVAFGQYTSVSATITDPNSQAYAGAKITATLTPAGQVFNSTGTPPPSPVEQTADATGTFSMSLADNTKLSGPNSQWTFYVCAPPSFSTCFSSAQTISGSSQSLTSALSSASVAFYTQTLTSLSVGTLNIATKCVGCGSLPSGPAGGDLGGTYPNPQVNATHLTLALPVAQGGTGNTAAFPLLSALFSDVTAASPTRGDGIFAIGASPTWQRLGHPSVTGGYFKWNGTDIAASTLAAAGTGSCTNQAVTATNADASPNCTTLTSAYVDTSIASTASSGFTGTVTGGSYAGTDSIIGANYEHVIDPFSYGVWSNNSSTTITCTSSASSALLACTGIGDFVKNQYIVMPQAGPICGTPANSTCTAPTFTVTATGTTGATTYNYKISTRDGAGGVGAASTAVTIANGNATLSNTNFNDVAVASPTSSVAEYLVYCSVGAGAFAYVGSFNPSTLRADASAHFQDATCAAQTPPLGVPSLPPASNVNDWLSAKINSIAGNNPTLSATATAAVTNGVVAHDDAAMLQLAINAVIGPSGKVLVPPVSVLANTRISIPGNASNIGIDAYGATINDQYNGNLLTFSDGVTANHPANVSINGLTIFGGAQGLAEGTAARQNAERAFGAQIGVWLYSGESIRFHNLTVQSVGGMGVGGIKSPNSTFAEQIQFYGPSIRFVGANCMNFGKQSGGGLALDDVELYSGIMNNCGDMIVGAPNRDNAGVIINAAAKTIVGTEFSAIRNQDNVNGFLVALLLRAGTSMVCPAHFEANTANQANSLDMFLENNESGDYLCGISFDDNQTTAAQEGVQVNGDAVTISGVTNGTGSNHNMIDFVNANNATNIQIWGISNKQCSNCNPTTAYVSTSGTTTGQIAPDPVSSGGGGAAVSNPNWRTLGGSQAYTETTAPSGVANQDLVWADSTAHRLKMNNNNGGAANVFAGADLIAPTDTGSANALAITVPSFPAAIATGLCVNFKASNSSTGATTLNVTPTGGSAYGAINLMKRTTAGVAALSASGDVVSGGMYGACYDGMEWVLGTPSSTVYTAGALTALAPIFGNSNNQVQSTSNITVDATKAFFNKYNGQTTAAQGVPPILASVSNTAQTALIPTTTLCTAALCGNASAGQYDVLFNFWGSGTACSSVTAGSVTFLLTWTDENAVTHSAVALQMQAQTGAATTAMQASFPFQTALANESASGSITISTNGTIIQYATGYTACTTGTGTYNLRATVRRHV